MAFTASAVSKLDYDFTKIPKEDGQGKCSGKGTVPEPSTVDLQQFISSLNEMAEADDLTDNTDSEQSDSEKSLREQLAEAQTKIEALSDDREKTTEILAGLTKDSPSKEQIDELPHRYFQAFFTWLMREVSPEV